MESKLYKCECHGHILEHEYDEEDKRHYFTFWTHGTQGEEPSFGLRLKEAWRILTGKKLRGFWGVILNDEQAQRLADDIEKSQNKIF